MRVGFLLWDGFVGGAEKLTAELAAGLRHLQIDASVLFVRDPMSLGEDLRRLEVPYSSFGAQRVWRTLAHPRAFARYVGSAAPDGVLVPHVGHLAIALRLGGYRKPIVAIQHGELLLVVKMPILPRARQLIERRLAAPLIDGEIAVSDYMLEEIRRHARPGKLVRIHNGVDLDRFVVRAAHHSPQPGLVVGCATRLTPGKGTVEVLRAFASIARVEPTVKLRIAGDGPERPRLEDLIGELRLSERVELVGVLHDMPTFWRETDVAVMPSVLPESFGIAALEAMASGKPVVATDNGGIVEVVEDGVTGRLVPVGSVDAISDALLGYLRDPPLRESHGLAGRRRAEALFSMSRCAEEYARLLEAMNNPGPARVDAGR